MITNYNKSIIGDYSPISAKGGAKSRRRLRHNKKRQTRKHKRNNKSKTKRHY